jgi:hypothetical protein
MVNELDTVKVRPKKKPPGFWARLFGAKGDGGQGGGATSARSGRQQQTRKPAMDFGLSAGWSKEEAFLCLLLAAALADGNAHADEIEEIEALFHRLNVFEKQGRDKVAEMRRKVQSKLMPEEGKPMKAETWKSAAKTLTKNNLGPTAFANAADIVFADRVVESEEVEFLRQLIAELNVEAHANDIIRIIKLKNHHVD